MSLSSLRGKVVMLQFTASWCGVCRKEMPFIEKDIWLKMCIRDSIRGVDTPTVLVVVYGNRAYEKALMELDAFAIPHLSLIHI